MPVNSKTKIKTAKELKLALSEGLKHRVRNPTIEKYQPHPKQKEFHTSLKPGRLFIGGNRSGKTYGGGAEATMYARGIHPYKKLPWELPLRLRVVTVDLVEGLHKIVLPEIMKQMPPSSLINGSWEDSWNSTLRTLTLENGSFIEFMTYEQELAKFAGTSRHGIWFDEEPPKDIFTECKLRLLDVEGHWWITMTPVDGMTWSYEDLYEPGMTGNDPYIHVVEVDMDDNPHLSEQGKAMVLSGLSDDEINARKHGQYVSVGGLIYKEFGPDNIIPEIDFNDFPKQNLVVAAMDHGYANPTAFLWAHISKNGTVVIFDEYYVAQEIIKNHATNFKLRNLKHGFVPQYTVGDPAIKQRMANTGTSVQTQYMEQQVPIALGNNDVQAGIDRVKTLIIQKKLLVTENCVDLIRELKHYRWATWKTKSDRFDKNRKEEPQKKNDHACDALRYLVASRPEVEDGVTVPVGNWIGAPEATSPDGQEIDTELVRGRSRSSTTDFHLGDDW